ncbi:uncharacterized protein PFL1_03949 [Pseudozyma flocculosa PF-1]|uniref:Related to GRH1 - acetylated protein, involved in ER to Golgi transport n=2 Tax=Pseudozyma flocculosa TaxID=84751 RepID=A0A5C3F022_9BASI|nr:uncharacterized protein PFL1_03949 [Pseudozyma flocculosa PF-1]EPQ28646.1 hypothetical protein PFL1_03949 [Pseudozyma flocculosa PF-1]SPO36591.1 related to GRH1 - acetylated protein, involved in ER to Golgi transport [Pseudozyma flocculosa]
MGASESRPRLDDSDDAPKQGYHVVRVAAGSPAHLAGIEPFFDFCVGIDGVALDPSKDVDGDRNSSDSTNPASGGSLAGLGAWKSLEEREGTRVILNVWSSKRQELREVPIIPSRAWSEASTAGSASSQPSLLGLSLRLCNPSLALSHVWHILEILEGSPAESAGLVPFGDFVIGWTGGTLKSEGDFYELVEAHVDRALRLYVYNSDYDHTREVIIVPNREWGGEGLLGCGVGYGLLHRIPKPQDRPAVPSDLDEDSGARTPQPASQSTQLSASNDSGPPRGPRSIADEQAGAPEPYRPGRGEHANGYDQSERGRGEGDEEGDDDDDDDDEMNRSGVTVSMRRDEDDEED